MVHSILLSLEVATISSLLVLVLGTLAGHYLATTRWRGRVLLEVLFLMPLVFPPTLTGYYLILLFGRNGWVGRYIHEWFGIQLTFHLSGAILAAAVVAFPLMVMSSRASIQGVDPNLRRVGYLLGRSRLYVFFRVTLPLAWRGLLAGLVLAFARSIGEFGATLMMAGNLRTMPLAIYGEWITGGIEAAAPLVLAHTIMAVVILAAALFLGQRHGTLSS